MKTRMTWMAGLAAMALAMILTTQTASAGERDRNGGSFRGHDESAWRGGSSWDRDHDRSFGHVYVSPSRYYAPTRYYVEEPRRVVYVTPTYVSRPCVSSGLSIRIFLGD